jgi:hypothetical protein
LELKVEKFKTIINLLHENSTLDCSKTASFAHLLQVGFDHMQLKVIQFKNSKEISKTKFVNSRTHIPQLSEC